MISIVKALNPAYRQFKPIRKEVENFKSELLACLESIGISDSRNESEEHLKEPIKKFLTNTFYQKNLINTKDRIDLAIYLDKTAKSDVGVIIEAKRPSNKAEFISTNNINKKALQEVLLYYLRERIDYKNNNIKQIIVTNGIEWFFFKGEDFYDYFYKNTELIKEYARFRDGLKDTAKNELFYKEIAAIYIEKVKDKLPYVHIKLDTKEITKYNDTKISNLYKLFSDTHLLGKSFGNDSNKLNNDFYKELLHIIGLEEIKEKTGSKKVIVRKDPKERDYASILENTIYTLEDKSYLDRITNIPNSPDKAFNVGLELCINWINRILFLKLLESQLVSYNKSKEYKFLNFNFLNGYDALNDLFFSALARPLNERHDKNKERFKNIPYLNSSLFEHSEMERLTFDITALKDEEMQVFSGTILKDNNGKKLNGKLNTLDYIFRFLDSYDFSADANTDIEDEQNGKTLINASVLGLIFEKINGYKDGSFYTPGYITMFMCKEAIREAVVDKFKAEYHHSIETFEDVKAYCQNFFKKEDRIKLNNTINTLKICDPAVGSGHFLVSALNELIAVKSELGILSNEQGERIPCEVSIENDELYIAYNEGELFEYNRQDVNSLHIQKTLFHEKQTLIENCLFGVDINPNSVNICRLRLWIELLKNAYYTTEGKLQTLPNIDINIKCGNSLVHRFKLDDSLKQAFKNKEVTYSINDYKTAVSEYKHTNSKAKKAEVETIIRNIKNNFRTTLDAKIKEKISKAVGEYENEKSRLDNLVLFGEKIKKADKDNLKKLKLKAEKLTKEKQEILDNVMFQNSFEWRFEFPEVLADDGSYVGFDVIIGNPPYIRVQGIRDNNPGLAELYVNNYKSATGSFDIYALFVEICLQLIKQNGIINFIMPSKWTNSSFGIGLRTIVNENKSISKLIDFGQLQIFDASTYTSIHTFKKNSNLLKYYKTEESCSNDLDIIGYLNNIDSIEPAHIDVSINKSQPWTLTNSEIFKLLEKLKTNPYRISDIFENIFQGLATSKDDVYFLYNCFIENDLIKGFSKQLQRNVVIEIGLVKPLLKGDDVHRYEKLESDKYVIFPYKLENSRTELFSEDELSKLFPNGYSYLKECEIVLRDREKGR
ncbi:Eco57I restriction-modification methylase domain-containing protein, partial [Empedobacter tilapiae]|uniref:type IIG restriction enzyme/methyltransferase n=1 Tax=Empedobacter tilapiae TaxID=2491114 RepID=UPI0028D08778